MKVQTISSQAKRKDKIKQYRSAWYSQNRKEVREASRRNRIENTDVVRALDRAYYAKNRQRKRETARLRYAERKEAAAEYNRRPEVKARNAALKAVERKSNPAKRIHWNMSRSIRLSLNNKGGRKWERVVGYNREALMAHLEALFLPGMTWENYGKYGWHIDHIMPRVAFEFTCDGDQAFKDCWSLKNLRPLWAYDNHAKSDKLEGAPHGLARYLREDSL